MFDAKKGPTQRQLRVGEEIRHAISNVLLRNEVHEPDFETISITVSEVRISPDLKNASVYVTPLAGGGDEATPLLRRVNELASPIRRAMNKHIALKFSPRLHFKLDKSFEEAGRINELLQKPEVRKDTSES